MIRMQNYQQLECHDIINKRCVKSYNTKHKLNNLTCPLQKCLRFDMNEVVVDCKCYKKPVPYQVFYQEEMRKYP